MNPSAYPRLRSALWAVLLLSLATAAVGGIGLRQWLVEGSTPTPAGSTEPAAVVPGGHGEPVDHSVVAPLDPVAADEVPQLSVAAYER